MAESSNKVTILVAIIGLLGTIGTAVISNWEKITGIPEGAREITKLREPEPDVAPARRIVESAPRVKNVAGRWRDINFPGNGFNITQDDERIRFNGWGVGVTGVPFQTTGNGSVNGDNISMTHAARDRFGGTSTGSCSGTLASDATRIMLTCTDSAVGTFVATVVRQ